MKRKVVDFSKFSSIRVGGKRELFIVESIDELSKFKDFRIVGGANNLLVSPSGDLQLIQLSKEFDYINIEDQFISIGGATPNGKIFNFAKQNDISGFEFLQNLPSTLGGMVKMNAGVKEYETFNNLISITTERGYINKIDIDFGYRHTEIDGVIFEAKFQIKKGFSRELVEKFKSMRSNQPKEPSAGSTFKNPQGFSAGKLIEDVGLKGFRVGDMAFSDIHANFLVNLGGGQFSEAISLIQMAEDRVFSKFGVKLEREICIVE